MATKSEIAAEILRSTDGRQWISRPDIRKITGMAQTAMDRLLCGVDSYGNGRGKLYLYSDVAARLAGQDLARRKRA